MKCEEYFLVVSQFFKFRCFFWKKFFFSHFFLDGDVIWMYVILVSIWFKNVFGSKCAQNATINRTIEQWHESITFLIFAIVIGTFRLNRVNKRSCKIMYPENATRLANSKNKQKCYCLDGIKVLYNTSVKWMLPLNTVEYIKRDFPTNNRNYSYWR